MNERVEADRRLILEAQDKGGMAKLGAYTRLSGPGWLQSAIPLGGGSLVRMTGPDHVHVDDKPV